MKKIILLFLLLSAFGKTFAQERGTRDFDKRLFQARLAEVCYRLNLSDEVKEKFAPIYEQYCSELHALSPKSAQPKMHSPEAGKPKRPDMPSSKGGKALPPKHKSERNDAERVKDIKHRLEAQHLMQELRLSYLEKFGEVLTDKQLVAFYEVEEDIQRKLHQRAMGAGKPAKMKHQ